MIVNKKQLTGTTVKLSGQIGKRFGRVHTLYLDTRSPREAVQALCNTVEGFRAYMSTAHKDGIEFAVFRGKDGENISSSQLGDPSGGVIRIAAVPSGSKSGVLQTVLGVGLIALSFVPLLAPAAPYLLNAGIAMAAGGVIQMLSPQAKLSTDSNNGDTSTSYVFSGAVNTSAQGNPVPLLYGRMIVGSAVISAGIEAEDYSSASSNVVADSGTVSTSSTEAAAVSGAKSSGKTKSPTEAENSLRSIEYFRIVDLIAEGEIVGLVNGLQSVYLNKTPLAAADGTLNFDNVTVIQRLGTQDQEYIQGFSSVESETSVGTELKSDTPWTVSLTDLDLSAVRVTLSVASLEKQDTKTGDINGYEIDYNISVSTDGGAYQTAVTSSFNGKTTSEYDRSHRIDLPAATTGWNVRVTRTTANANSTTIADTTNIVSYTEIVDAKLRYPNCALIAMVGDAQAFSSIPDRAYDMKGRIISVPSNYDPDTRVYTGTWDGSFKPAWTDNPAWVYYDMCTNDRFGLGNLIDSSQVDKWNLYRIAEYCDQLVSNGKGGQEPRFTCNLYLQAQADAYRVLQDLATVFRGVSYWMGGKITPSADMPDDSYFTYDTSNVVGGLFTYSSSSRSNRYTTALVTWNDPSNFYAQTSEYCQYQAGLNRYGIRQTSIAAIGCTSQGQAQRLGNWNLINANVNTETVTFQVGLDGTHAAPGRIIRVIDHARAGVRNGGRIKAATTTQITLDKAPGDASVGDTLTVNMPDVDSNILPVIRSQTRTIQAIADNVITVSSGFSSAPAVGAVWSVDTTDLSAQTFRVTSITEDDSDDAKTFTITAVTHNASVFAAVDDGTVIQIPSVTKLQTGAVGTPTNIAITSYQVVQQAISNTVMTISWTPPSSGASYYEVEWQKDNGSWVKAGTSYSTSLDVTGIYTGTYIARVTAFNSAGDSGTPGVSAATQLLGKTGSPPTLTSLTATSLIFGIKLDWGFPEGAEDTQYTEIYASKNNVRPDDDATIAYDQGDYAYPTNSTQISDLSAGASLFFWGRLIDKAGNVGGWYPTTGAVNGQSSSDATVILAYLTGQITATQLSKDLLSQIQTAVAAGTILWQSTATYSQDDFVYYDGKMYVWTSSTAGNEEPPGTDGNWQEAGSAIAQYNAIVGQINSNTSSITNLNNTVTAQGTTVSGIVAQLDVNGSGDSDWGAGDTTVYAGTITVQSVSADNDLATAKRVDTVEASITSYSAQVQTIASAQATVAGKVDASYTVKVGVTTDGQYYSAGYAVGLSNETGAVQSQFLVLADRFALLTSSSGGTATSPFVIQGGQTFINQALIGTGWITNAMIGNTIQSTSVNSAGNPTWLIDKSGTITLNGDSFKIVHSSTGMVMTNSSGVKVVELGVLS